MSKIWVGPTGNTCAGHVLDVNKAPFLQALKDYDPQLYVQWNPKKLRGWGCWEIRRSPSFKTITEILELEGNFYTRLEYKENNLVHHVLDAAFLNYDQLSKLKRMDTWKYDGGKGYVDALEAQEREWVAKKTAEAKESRSEAAKHYKREIKDLKELVQSGMNPALIGQYWNKGKT